MNKEELLQQLSIKISTGEMRREEVASRFDVAPAVQNEVRTENLKPLTPFSVTKILYVLGAAIVIIGIAFFVFQIWDDIGSSGRIAVTLGLGLLLAAIGSVLLKSRPDENIGAVFHFIGGMLIPGGAAITLLELNIKFTSLWPVTFTFGAIFAFYLLLTAAHKNAILTIFSIINGTAFIYLLTGSLTESADFLPYLTMAVGVSYLLLAHSFRGGWNNKLTGILYLLGSTGFLGAAFSKVPDSVLWQMLYFIIVIGGLVLSVYVKSRSILAISTFSLIAHISYITAEYFADSFGWPLSLVILGFVFIGLGYGSINVSKKYIAN